MFNNRFYLILIFNFIYFLILSYEYTYFFIAKGFIQCKKSDPDFDECLKGALQSGLPHLAKGINKLLIINKSLGF